MWMENTATAALLIPIVLTVSNRISDLKKAKEVRTLLTFGIAYAASLGGMATIIGSASNAMASGFLAEIRPFNFLDWIVYGLPLLIILLPTTWFLLLRYIPVSDQRIDIEAVKVELTELGRLRQSEVEVSLTLTVTVILWMVGPWLELMLGLPSTLFSPAVVGILAASYLSVRGLIDWEDVKGVSWGMFLTITAGLALGDSLTRSGASNWLMNILKPILVGPPLILSLTVLVLATVFLTNIMNNATIVAIIAPILIAIGEAEPTFNPIPFILPMALATTFGYSLPSASGRMALISAMDLIEKEQMLRIGIKVSLVSSLLLILFIYTLSVVGFI